MKQTQYTAILDHLRRAGERGAAIRELQVYSNYPWKRIDEMTHPAGYIWIEYGGMKGVQGRVFGERIERDWREHNGRKIRVYKLRRV